MVIKQLPDINQVERMIDAFFQQHIGAATNDKFPIKDSVSSNTDDTKIPQQTIHGSKRIDPNS